MEKLEDRESREFKAKEATFYSDCQIYTSEIERCRKTEAREERKNLENKR